MVLLFIFIKKAKSMFFMFLILGSEIDGSIVEVTLAKPVDKNQYFRFTRGVSPSTITANIPVNLHSFIHLFILNKCCIDLNISFH